MNFVVVGAGAWGTAFALHLVRLGHSVVLAPRRREHAEALRVNRENADYLPGVSLPSELQITADLTVGLAGADVALLACPSQAVRETAGRLRDVYVPGAGPSLIVSLTKGLELNTHRRASEVLADNVPGATLAVHTGPTNAAEVVRGLPVAMVLASAAPGRAISGLQSAISNRTLRVYTSDDLAGVEFGGALKNIYAIAAGCADGLGLGDNANAALLTRALAEMVRVGTTLGARAETFYGLSGFGDLVATSHGGWSRNREFGRQIGAGARVVDRLENRKTVVEGYRTTEWVPGRRAQNRIEAPVLHEMHGILFSGRRPADALASLMPRGLKGETAAVAPVV